MHSLAAADECPSDDSYYQAMLAHDARFDGRFFVGVTSTRVYCRPVCRVRTPLRRNCRFFSNAPGAEAAGFRPCLRCRPELAPGLSLIDSPGNLAQHAARQFDHAVAAGVDLYLPAVAQRLGVTDRHLRRIFQAAFGVSPVDYLSTRRLLLAKQLLTDTPLPVTSVAHMAGFASLRRFNDAFATRYRMSPSALRKTEVNDGDGLALPALRAGRARPLRSSHNLTLRLAYRPPYDVAGVLRFFTDRALAGVEHVAGRSISRTLAWTSEDGAAATLHSGWLVARFDEQRHEVHVQLSPSLTPVMGAVLQRLRQTLDLDAEPERIDRAMAALPLPVVPGLRVPNGLDGFEIATRVILGQQVTVAAARTLTRRLVEQLGQPVLTPFPELNRLFPSAQQIAQADPELLGKLGIVRQRVRALQALAVEVHAGRIELHRGAALLPTLEALAALPGVGPWTVQLIALRALAWPDAFPASDIGVLNALGTRNIKAVTAQAEAWRPWRGYAVMRLWQSLETAT
jgi:AraC family transcriptional regulator, regulatory protein of adaptative response / DNA-3-methyladenine glycosylase II